MRRYKEYKDSDVLWIKQYPKDWTELRVKYFSEFKNGYSFKSTDFYEDEKYPVIRIGDLQDGKINIEGAIRVTEEVYQQTKRFVNKRGDILLALTGATIGKSAYYDTDEISLLNQRVAALRPNKKVFVDYLKYLIESYEFRTLIDFEGYGGAQENIGKGQITSAKFPIPLKSEQTQIIKYLDYKTALIDDFITSRKKQIVLLKEQRSSIIDHIILNGINSSTEYQNLNNNLFIKKLPSGWKLSSVRLEIMLNNIEQQDGNHGELHPVASDYVDDGIPFILASDVNDFSIDLIGCKKIPEEVASKLRIGFSITGDILLTHKGTIGRVGICDTNDYPYVVLTPQVTYYRIKRDYSPKYIFYQFQSNVFQEQLKLLSGGGSTRDYVGIVAQRDLRLIKPPINEQKEVVKKIEEEVSVIDDLTGKYQKQIELMQEYRTAIISQAVTGKIDVRDWQPNTSTQ